MTVKQIHLISTGTMSLEHFSAIAAEVHPYITYLHVREKTKTARELFECVDLMIKRGVPRSKIILNDRIDVAWAHQVAGVQLAYHSLGASVVKKHFPGLMIGCSIHNYEEAEEAKRNGADFCIYGHIYETGSKPGVQPRGVTELLRMTKGVEIPIVAIGGIKPENIDQVLSAGAHGIAVLSGILLAESPVEKARQYLEVVKEWGRNNGEQV